MYDFTFNLTSIFVLMVVGLILVGLMWALRSDNYRP